MEYRLGICDEDYHYVVNLMEYVNSHRIGGLSLVAFSSIQAVTEYLEKNYLDGLLMGQDRQSSQEALDLFAGEHTGLMIISLSGDRDSSGEQIYKYQNVGLIAKAVLERLNVSIAPEAVADKAFYAVYSPIGRCGKTTLAKGLGVNMRGSLYVGLEEFGTRDILGEDILYHIIIQNPKVHSLLQRLRPNEYGLREIKGILSYMDLRQLSKENLQWLKGQLLMGEDYDRVIFDIGGAVLNDLNILQVMDRIYVPVLEEEEAKIKLQAFKELLRCREYVELGKKLQYLEVPRCHYSSEMMKDFICKGEL